MIVSLEMCVYVVYMYVYVCVPVCLCMCMYKDTHAMAHM